MKFIMLQRLNPITQKNEGGLFLNTKHISALVPNPETRFTEVLMSCGTIYLTPFPVVEILDMLRESSVNKLLKGTSCH